MRPTKLVLRIIIVLLGYDDATKRTDDVEAGLTCDDATVTTSSPAAAESAFSDKAVRRAFIKKVNQSINQLINQVVAIIDQYSAEQNM